MNSYLDETRFPGLPGFQYGEAQETYTGMNDTAVYGFTGVTAEQAADQLAKEKPRQKERTKEVAHADR